MTNKQEQGRSMVEMLGVLAVVGVLSAGGIAGYTYAMDRHRTNEVLNEASKRAVVVASQIASGRPVSLAEFGTGETAGGTFATDAVTDIDDAVGIKVTGVKDSVCENLIKLENDRVYMAKDDASLTALTEADCTGDNAEFLIVFEGMGGGTDGGTTITCDESEKVSVTYTGGRCCNETKTGKFCPGEEPPTCVRDAGCDCEDETCCDEIGGDWDDNYGAYPICCSKGEVKCSDYECICVLPEEDWDCGYDVCISCPTGKAECPDEASSSSKCICAPEGKGACSLTSCIVCETGTPECPESGPCKCIYLCDETTKPEGDAWECNTDDGTWICDGDLCEGGPDAGKCMEEYRCACDEATKPDDGDGWVCDGNTNGKDWYCDYWMCTDGADEGKCMRECSCGSYPAEGNEWFCNTDNGVWECGVELCPNGPDKGKCMSGCSCDETTKPTEGDAWGCSPTEGLWECDNECTDGPDAGKCMWNCSCSEYCLDCGDDGYCWDWGD